MIVLTRRIDEADTVTGTVTLSVDSRIKSRLRVALDDGREAGLMLERGHLLRGGSPSAFDRVVAARFGACAVRALARGESGVMVALGGQEIGTVPVGEVAGRSRRVPVRASTTRPAPSGRSSVPRRSPASPA